DQNMRMILLLVVLMVAGCAKPPEQTYYHPKTGRMNLTAHLSECGKIADHFGIINMSPVHQYPMPNMKDHFQREKVFSYCMRKKGYEQNDGTAISIDATNTRIRVLDSMLAAGETSLVMISFSSPVGGLDNSDLTVENGSLSKIGTIDNGLTWTATFTPAPDLEDSSNVIRLDNSGVIDAVSNPGHGITISNNYVIKSLRPTIAVYRRAEP
ncbi:MAG: Ig-like domain-containing protein, partial [Geopsychrobacter sp.]|nr:Ig-like domain-containing protein [Geopsychrobacter sp.]